MKEQRHVILIAEDDPNDRLLLVTALRDNGVRDVISEVNDGKEALAYLQGSGKYADRTRYPFPSMILTDLKMPRMDGFAVLEIIRNNPDWAIMPTVVLSASADAHDIRQAYALGAKSYFRKPQSFEELSSLVKLMYEYWARCEVPEVYETGKMVETQGEGKLGARFNVEAKLS